jgi:hypothetical protein
MVPLQPVRMPCNTARRTGRPRRAVAGVRRTSTMRSAATLAAGALLGGAGLAAPHHHGAAAASRPAVLTAVTAGQAVTPAPAVTPAAAQRAAGGHFDTTIAATAALIPHENTSPYYEVSPTGAVWTFNGAAAHGSVAAANLATTVVNVTLTPDHGGYWEVTAAGGVNNFGDAGWYGSPRVAKLPMNPEGVVSTSDGEGYWVYGHSGMVAAYGDARSFGNGSRPIVDMVATPDSGGYWQVGPHGGVTTFGDARPSGGVTDKALSHPIVSMTPTADGAGYWLVSSGGNIFNEGDAAFEGSLAGQSNAQPMTSLLATPDGRGYWLVAHDGDIHSFGDAAGVAPPTLAFVHTVLTAGDRALEWAMAQLGKPYIYAGTGPVGFDCSGLAMMSWRAAGVDMERTAAEQYMTEPHVAIGQLVDGDLVYYESNAKPTSIYHTGIYLGAGHMVDAPYTGVDVRIDWTGGTDFVNEGAAP